MADNISQNYIVRDGKPVFPLRQIYVTDDGKQAVLEELPFDPDTSPFEPIGRGSVDHWRQKYLDGKITLEEFEDQLGNYRPEELVIPEPKKNELEPMHPVLHFAMVVSWLVLWMILLHFGGMI